MARTIRRKTKWLEHHYVGTREECLNDVMWWHSRYKSLTPEQAYERRIARLHRDHHQGHWNVPRDFRRTYGSKKVRTREAQKLHRHLRRDEWDDHLPINKGRSAAWYWF